MVSPSPSLDDETKKLTPEQRALARAAGRKKYHRRKLTKAATPPTPTTAEPSSTPTSDTTSSPTSAARATDLSDRLERQLCGMIADGLSFADIEAAAPDMPRAAQIALWATDKERYPRFVRRYERAQIAWAEQQLMALRSEIKTTSGKTRVDAIRYDLDRLAKRIGDGRASAGPIFSDQAPPWLKTGIAQALARIMPAAPHNADDPLQLDETE